MYCEPRRHRLWAAHRHLTAPESSGMFEIAPGKCQMPVKQEGYVVMNAEEAAVRRFYDAFAAKDWETARGCFTEDAVWHLPGRSRSRW